MVAGLCMVDLRTPVAQVWLGVTVMLLLTGLTLFPPLADYSTDDSDHPFVIIQQKLLPSLYWQNRLRHQEHRLLLKRADFELAKKSYRHAVRQRREKILQLRKKAVAENRRATTVHRTIIKQSRDQFRQLREALRLANDAMQEAAKRLQQLQMQRLIALGNTGLDQNGSSNGMMDNNR
uniref:Uncharacterized protein n=1 Tax=Magnetococcus massalia (strain MO-1) TaxID=451514 RepID=A0A1S7LKE5_MAGMO|nr:Protein of unknown function [Candidatus Magnetococcus massalia]